MAESADILQEARDAMLAVVRGEGGRNAMARLMAAKAILDGDYLKHITDEALLAELERREKKAKGAVGA